MNPSPLSKYIAKENHQSMYFDSNSGLSEWSIVGERIFLSGLKRVESAKVDSVGEWQYRHKTTWFAEKQPGEWGKWHVKREHVLPIYPKCYSPTESTSESHPVDGGT